MFYVMEAAFVLIGVISIYLGVTQYQFWIRTVPGGGFMPVLIGGLMILISILTMLDKNVRLKFKVERKSLIPVIAILITLILNLLIGLIPALTLMVFIWLKWFEKYPLKASIITTVFTSAFTYAIFGWWLRVPFPTGLF